MSLTRKGRPKGSLNKSKIDDKSKIDITEVFIRNSESKKLVKVNRGGARSSKSYSIIQLLIDRFFTVPNRQILITRKTAPSLRRSCYRDVIRYLNKLDLYSEVKELKQEQAIVFGSSLIQFAGLDDPTKIKSTEWNDIFMEEANEFNYEDYVVLKTRLSSPDHGVPNGLFLAFNPEDSFHWIKEKVVDTGENVEEIHSSYKNNPFLSESYVKELLALENENPNYFRIYGLGEWGKLDNLIYTNWDTVDTFPKEPEEIIYGLDFGFNAPSALIKIGILDEEIWEEQLIYSAGLTNQDLITEMKQVIPVEHRSNKYVVCDSAAPDRISEIETAGFTVIPASKQIKEGIDMVKRYKVHIIKGSDDLIKEKRSYSWKTDKRSGRVMDEPVKFNDHLMDAERYCIHTYFKEIGSIPQVRYI